MLMRRLVPGCFVGLFGIAACQILAAQNAPGQLAYVEQLVPAYQTTQQRVIVPVREYRTVNRLHGWWNPFREPHWAQHQVPVTRWEERIQTSYVPTTQRQYRPVMETSMRQLPPLQLATRPRTNIASPYGGRLYDDPPMVAIHNAPPATRTAQVQPTTTLAPQTFKPAARAPMTLPSAPATELKPGNRASTWSR